MSSDTVIPALGRSRPEARLWQVDTERADRSGQLQEQALGSDFATNRLRVAPPYLQPSLASNEYTRHSDITILNVLIRTPLPPDYSYHDWLRVQLEAAPSESQRILSPDISEVWDEEDDTRFELLVERKLARQLTTSEREELEVLSKKRNRTLTRVSNEAMERENLKEAALIELQNLIDKYAPLFVRRVA